MDKGASVGAIEFSIIHQGAQKESCQFTCQVIGTQTSPLLRTLQWPANWLHPLFPMVQEAL